MAGLLAKFDRAELLNLDEPDDLFLKGPNDDAFGASPLRPSPMLPRPALTPLPINAATTTPHRKRNPAPPPPLSPLFALYQGGGALLEKDAVLPMSALKPRAPYVKMPPTKRPAATPPPPTASSPAPPQAKRARHSPNNKPKQEEKEKEEDLFALKLKQAMENESLAFRHGGLGNSPNKQDEDEPARRKMRAEEVHWKAWEGA